METGRPRLACSCGYGQPAMRRHICRSCISIKREGTLAKSPPHEVIKDRGDTTSKVTPRNNSVEQTTPSALTRGAFGPFFLMRATSPLSRRGDPLPVKSVCGERKRADRLL